MAGTRVAVVASFVLFALLAAPLAWQLTRVERAPLPSARIQRLVAARNGSSALDSGRELKIAIYARGSAVVEFPAVAGVVFERRKLLVDPAAFSVDEKERQQVDDRLDVVMKRSKTPVDMSVVLLCREEEDAANAPLIVGKHRHAWTAACELKRGSELSHAVERLVAQLSGSKTGFSDEGVARRALKFRLRFSLLKENPAAHWMWDFDDLSARYLRPMIQKASVLADFTEEMQVAHYARLAHDVHVAEEGGEPFFYVTADDLKQFKSTNDFLESSVLEDREQVLHFMAALPDENHAPLVIHDVARDGDKPRRSGSRAFEIPGWGIVVMLDPKTLSLRGEREGKEKGEREMRRVMGLFISQFRRLIGAPSFLHRQQAERLQKVHLEFLPSIVDGIADWELDTLMRLRYEGLLQSTIDTLASIVQLVDDMPEMSVLDRVQHRIVKAVEFVESILCSQSEDSNLTCSSLDVETKLQLVRQAAALTDEAYYDHTMIRQLYFPQEQMLGVYAPLLAPLILPFFLGFVREAKRWKQKQRAKQQQVEGPKESKQD